MTTNIQNIQTAAIDSRGAAAAFNNKQHKVNSLMLTTNF
jgi:hypothetical protein